MKRFITILICIGLLALTILNLNRITNKLANYFKSTPKANIQAKNQYSKNKNYEYIQLTDNFEPYNYQELLNVFYTILDSGYDVFTFYCPEEYTDCIKDVQTVSDQENNDTLTTLGNFVSPYNNFSSLKVKYDTAGEVTVTVNHLYSDEEIKKISNKIDSIFKEIVTEGMDNIDIIYAFHDYIINHTQYDETFDEKVTTNTYESNKATGPLFQGYAICSGYTDAMALLLDKLGINNYKVASDTHVWNAFYMNDKWWHVDLTWDDPVVKDATGNKKDKLEHTFFKIDTETLDGFNIENHSFDKSIYIELK